MTNIHIWPQFVAVDLSDAGGPARFGIVNVGHSGFELLSGETISGLTTLGAVDRYLQRERGMERAPSDRERAAALHGAIFGWDAKLSRPAAHKRKSA